MDRQCDQKGVKSPSASIYFNRRSVHGTMAGIASIVDWTPNRQSVVDVDRPSDRSSDSIRRPTPAVVRASIMEFGFPFFQTAPPAICVRRGKGWTRNRLLLRRSAAIRVDWHHITQSPGFCFPLRAGVNLFISPSVNKLLRPAYGCESHEISVLNHRIFMLYRQS